MVSPLTGIVSGLAAPLFGLVDQLFTSDEERAEARRRLLEMEQRGELAQIAVNLEEARSESLFVAGWRPFIGWTCGSALAYEFVVKPLLIFAANAGALWFDGPLLEPELLPELDWGALMPLLLGLLGLGGLRTLEKVKGANKNR